MSSLWRRITAASGEQRTMGALGIPFLMISPLAQSALWLAQHRILTRFTWAAAKAFAGLMFRPATEFIQPWMGAVPGNISDFAMASRLAPSWLSRTIR